MDNKLKIYNNRYFVYNLSKKNFNLLLDYIKAWFDIEIDREIDIELPKVFSDYDFFKLISYNYKYKKLNEIKKYQKKSLSKIINMIYDITKDMNINFKNQKFLDIGIEDPLLLKLIEDKFNCHCWGLNIKDEFPHYNKKIFNNPRIILYDGYNLPFEDNFFFCNNIFSYTSC